MTRLFDWFKRWIADVATTPLIITSGIGLSGVYVLWALLADTLGRPLTELTLNTIGLFLAGMLAGGVTQFGIKRYSDDRALAAKHGTAVAPAQPRKTQEVTRVDS